MLPRTTGKIHLHTLAGGLSQGCVTHVWSVVHKGGPVCMVLLLPVKRWFVDTRPQPQIPLGSESCCINEASRLQLRVRAEGLSTL
jgi:anti-sigma-K factor RskA